MNILNEALDNSRAKVNTFRENALVLKDRGFLNVGPSVATSSSSGLFGDTANRQRYALFRGWLYSAINALASEAAGQPVNLARLTGSEGSSNQRSKPGHITKTMPDDLSCKSAHSEFENIPDHPLLSVLERPNPIQRRWQFVYSFVANLNITGWSYIVGGDIGNGEIQLFTVPTTWVHPIHKPEPFSKFLIFNPDDPSAPERAKPIGRENVAFAHLPNPANPLGALAPSQAQMTAIRIDDHIQTSQERFFDNGIFPSTLITIGKNPHPEVASGIRPRLTSVQRRQVMAAITRDMRGVTNYGNPAILDGMVEKIERLSATQNEMGWEKSEGNVRTRILSAFGVHPYILGEPVNVGGYAQAAKIEERFCKRVNSFLGMLSAVVTNFIAPMSDDANKLFVWWDKCEPHDPQLESQNIRDARKNGDISRNEYRAFLGFPPDETGGNRNKLFTPGDLNGIMQLQDRVSRGVITVDQVKAIYETLFDLEPEEADRIAGDPISKPIIIDSEVVNEQDGVFL